MKEISPCAPASDMLSVKHMEFAMPKGPNGEKRPADAVGLAVYVARIATGEVDDAPLAGC